MLQCRRWKINFIQFSKQLNTIHYGAIENRLLFFFLPEKEDLSLILVIAEKPSVAQTIAAVFGAKEKKDGFHRKRLYRFWCVGHRFAEAATYGEQYKKWSFAMTSLRILPQEWKYTVADNEKQFKTLKELFMHRADVSRSRQCLRRRARGRTHFPFCL